MQDQPNAAGSDCPATISLTLEQRGRIYRELDLEVYSFTDFALSSLRNRHDFERLRDAIRFLEEIGPEPLDPRDSFEVTMPTGQLKSVLHRVLKGANEGLVDVG